MLARSRLLLNEARIRVEGTGRLDAVRARLLTLALHEIGLVDWLWRGTKHNAVRRLAMTVSWLGNGIAYVVVGMALLATTKGAIRPVGGAVIGVGLGQCIYPWVKLASRRPRPFELRPHLLPPLRPLDLHSFPSGHAMTLTAALTPFVIAWPAIWPVALLLSLAMGWSRIASAHHYPSDIVAGSALGLIVAIPAVWLLAPA